MDDRRLLTLLEHYIEGTLDDPGRAELEALIVAEPAARQAFWEYLEQHAAILELKGEARGRALARLEKPPTRRRASSPRQSFLIPLLAAGVLVGVVLLLVMSATDSSQNIVRPPKKKAPEIRLREIEQEREKVINTPTTPEPERKKMLEDLDERKRRIDEELKAATRTEVVIEKKPEEPKQPLPTPEEEKKTTVAAAPVVATIVKVDGDPRFSVGQELHAGQALEGNVDFGYPDQTRVELRGAISNLTVDNGKRFALDRGSLRSSVAKQKGAPMVIDTPLGIATIRGTIFRLTVDQGTRLEVEEGVVNLKHKTTGKSVDVAAGFYAVAAAGVDLRSQALPIDEILLTPAQAKVTGGEWKLTKEGLETAAVFRSGADALLVPSYVTISFDADANRDYHVWVRGECLGKAGDRGLQDGIILKFARSQVVERLIGWGKTPLGPDGVGLSGWGRDPGVVWIGGDGDWYDAQGARTSDSQGGTSRRGDEVPAVVRFARPGLQTLRMIVFEGPMRVDAIWLSTTQKTRPDPAQGGPVKK